MASNKFVRAFLDPIRAAKIINRRYLQFGLRERDPEISLLRGWPYGELDRDRLIDCFPGIEDTSFQLVRPYDRTENMSMSVGELNVLLAIQTHMKALRVLEIGTFDGGTTVNLSANLPRDGRVVTVDLPPDKMELGLKIAPSHDNSVEAHIVGRQFKGSPYESGIDQVLADSAKIDFRNIGGPFDLILIDGCHDYAYVKSDSENALRALSPNGVVVWHDYSMIEDVAKYVDELSLSIPIRSVRGTRLAIHAVNWKDELH